jgi:hypothetical protein
VTGRACRTNANRKSVTLLACVLALKMNFGSFFMADSRPQCIVNLKRGKNLANVLKAILLEEPKVISANLIYFVS